MACLSVAVLGSLTVTQDGQPVSSFEYNKVKGLFSYLIAEADRPHRREALAGLLWPDQSQKAALDSLRNALSKLRLAIRDRTADPPFLFITSDAIQFNRSSDHDLDLERFTNLLAAVKTHTHRRLESCKTCRAHLKQAAGLYRGDFLAEFSLPDSDLFEDWLRSKRDRYSQGAQHALHQLASILEWQADYDGALVYARRQLELDPCQEVAHQQIIRLLASQGLRSDACEQYERCRESLANDLGVEPSVETTRLYEQVKYGTFQAASAGRKHLNHLPPSLTSFVGRERELTEINALMDDPTCRLLTLVGPGGVGKTRLAVAVASQQLESFPQGACFVSLAAISSIEHILPNILQALGLKITQGVDLKAQLLGYLKDKELLLVLDNFEHLVEGAELVNEIMQQAAGVMVLVTSRQRLNLQAEWLFDVGGLNYPPAKVLDNLASYEAVQLFDQRLHQFKPRLTLFEDDLCEVARICRLVEGLPLGIELAVSAIRTRSIAQVAASLESGKEDLAVSYRDLPERHRSIRAVFEHSWRLLTPQEQTAFINLAVFRGGFTAEAALKIANAPVQELSSLVERSLLRYDPQLERYDIHELLLQFALEKLKAQAMEPTLHQKHFTYFTLLAEQADEAWMVTHSTDLMKTLSQDADNYRAALQDRFATGQMELTLQLAGALGMFWVLMDRWDEGFTWLTKVLDCGYPFTRSQHLARALLWAGWLEGIHDSSLAREYREQALTIWRELGDELKIAYALSDLGRWYGKDPKKSRLLLEQSLEIYRKLDNQAFIARQLILLASSHLESNDEMDLIKARDLLAESQAITRRLGKNSLTAWSDEMLGTLEMNLGNFARACTLFEEGLELGKTADTYLRLELYDKTGLTYFYLDNSTAAHAFFEKGLQIALDTGQFFSPTYCHYSYLVCREGEPEKALYYLKEAFRRIDQPSALDNLLDIGGFKLLAGVLAQCGELQRSVNLFAYLDAFGRRLSTSRPLHLRPDHEHDLALARQQLGEVAFSQAWQEGLAMTYEQIKSRALEARVRVTQPTSSEIKEPDPEH